MAEKIELAGNSFTRAIINMHVIGVPEREESKKKSGTMSKNFLIFLKIISSHIQAAQQSPISINTKENDTKGITDQITENSL